jgi:hypothetical protein
MAISRSQLVKELEPGFECFIRLGIQKIRESNMLQIFDSENSDRAFEEEVMLSGFANAQTKPEGSAVTLRQRSRNFHFSLHARDNCSCISQSLKKRLKTICMIDLASRYTKALARSMANTKQVKAANVLNNAFNSKLTLVETE